MIVFPQPGQFSQYSYKLEEQRSDAQSLVKQQESGDSLVRVQASYSSSITLSVDSSASSLTYSRPAANVNATEAVADAPERTQAASNILAFIELRVAQDAADGASKEELAERIEQGLEGFIQGYTEAYEQIAGAGLLGPEVEAAIQSTYDQVLAGIAELAERFEIDPPQALEGYESASEVSDIAAESRADEKPMQTLSSPATTVKQGIEESAQSALKLSEMIEASTLSYARSEEREFAFKLKTQDGDEVTIYAAASRNASLSASAVNYGENTSSGRVSAGVSQASVFSFSVDGDIDESELSAINDLLRQVGDISDAFFSGNIEDAFELALGLGFDDTQIAQFSLNLKQSVATQAQAAYAQVGEQPMLLDQQGSEKNVELPEDRKIAMLARFVEMLREAAESAGKLGIERNVVPRLAEQVARENYGGDQAAERIKSVMDRLLG